MDAIRSIPANEIFQKVDNRQLGLMVQFYQKADADAEFARLEAEVERKDKALAAVLDLINDSQGVYGLHLNGDIAPWETLRTGGQFEQWLLDFDEALGGR